MEIRDGDSASAPLLSRFCGYDTPKPIHSTGDKLFIHFQTDSSVSKVKNYISSTYSLYTYFGLFERFKFNLILLSVSVGVKFIFLSLGLWREFCRSVMSVTLITEAVSKNASISWDKDSNALVTLASSSQLIKGINPQAVGI